LPNVVFATRYLVSQGCIKPLCDLLVGPDPRIVTVCLEGLENILKVGEAEKSYGSTGDVNLYAQMTEDVEGLEKGFENFLKVGEAEKSFGKTVDVNLYAQMIEDAEGLEKIDNLQNHDNNEIYEKAVKILETYWLEDEHETLTSWFLV
jgi:importin subunit alpha-6/7